MRAIFSKRRALIIIFISIFVLFILGYLKSESFRMLSYSLLMPIENFTFEFSDGHKGNFYYYSTNEKTKSENALIFIGGSERVSLKNYIRYYLSPLPGGFDVFSLQKRFVSDRELGISAESMEYKKNNFFQARLTDHIEFFDKTIQTRKNRYRRIILLGISEGGGIAVSLANRFSSITHLAIVGSGGLNQFDELKLIFKDDQKSLENEVAKVQNNPESLEAQMFGQTYKYWSSSFQFYPLPLFLSLKIPILIGFGENDSMVPIESAYLIEKEFVKNGKDNLSLRVFKNCDHTLKEPNGTLHREDFLNFLSSWVNKENAQQMPRRGK